MNFKAVKQKHSNKTWTQYFHSQSIERTLRKDNIKTADRRKTLTAQYGKSELVMIFFKS